MAAVTPHSNMLPAGFLCRKFLTPADKDNLFTIDHFPLWYRLAVENTPGRFYYYPVNDKGLCDDSVTGFTSLWSWKNKMTQIFSE